MSHLLSPLGVTAKSAVLLFSSRLSQYAVPRRIAGYCIHHGPHYATNNRRWHNVSAGFLHQGRRYAITPKKPSITPEVSATPEKTPNISDKTSGPLHILFCGSDDFSCASLKALHDEHIRNPDLIQSIEVVVRPGKRIGRGYKVVRDPPIHSLAESLGLQIHERDTFTGWNMPSKTNLIIAVSFGLFVPPRLLRGAKYGGLNLHPSLLPDLRGPAPLHHTLLSGRTLTGVSLQTLDHTAFDHGAVLAQTPSDPASGAAVQIPPTCTTVAALEALITPIAAEMLVHGLRSGLHVPPYTSVAAAPSDESALTHAPKITKEWQQLTPALLLACSQETPTPSTRGLLARRQDAIGPLWFFTRDRQGRQKRVLIDAIEELPDLPPSNRPPILAPASRWKINRDDKRRFYIPFERRQRTLQERDDPASNLPREDLVFWVPRQRAPGNATGGGDDDALYLGNYRVLSLKVEGSKAKPARQALQNFFIDHDH
ncbi:formyl transferase [Xylaria digitata]|nr:formyl transferase [Xylaria digitata]